MRRAVSPHAAPTTARHLHDVYRRLHRAYGPQHWWPGETPFEVMVGAVLTQNTAWSNVEKAIANLKQARALDANVIATTPHARLARWLKPSGYFNIKAQRLGNFCRWYLAQGGFASLNSWDTAQLRHGLLSVNGVGRETADDILLYAFARPVFVIDAYTRRLHSRLGHIHGDEGYESVRMFFESALEGRSRRPASRDINTSMYVKNREKVKLFNEFHALIVRHGKEVCRPRPRCRECCLLSACPSAKP